MHNTCGEEFLKLTVHNTCREEFLKLIVHNTCREEFLKLTVHNTCGEEAHNKLRYTNVEMFSASYVVGSKRLNAGTLLLM